MLAGAFSLDLFAGAMTQLVDDAEGGIRYWPGFVDAALAQEWFATLHAKAAWTHLQRPMYDRVVDVPRLLASYRREAFPPELPLMDMLIRIQAIAPAPFNGVGMNLYRDGNDSAAMHSDKLHMLTKPYPIDLEPGSLLCMSHASQLSHEHGIPKTKKPQGPRISVVFRVRPGGHQKD